ncbi:hypothetical protein NLJ89_g7209 [Agrocybe chaxingu]|uniref:Uncharacterized protein n=1 Tax=Agrocybe chaxingu TaxID=84603 RepID=A0A9W8MRZ3_9AGAR|nr:hypothetical protein NLJ89_g7209 [Agrocybe chaxingu]
MHLAINTVVETEVILKFQRECRSFCILLVIDDGISWELEGKQILDPRFVMLKFQRFTVEDWIRSAKGKENMWLAAELKLSLTDN